MNVNPAESGQFTVEAEDAIISAFIQLVIKLNEVAFTPVFRQLYDWAFSEGRCCLCIRAVSESFRFAFISHPQDNVRTLDIELT